MTATATFAVAVTDDALLEATETVIATISNPSNAAVTISTASATANITDNDTATLSINDITQNETDAGTTAFTVTLDVAVDTGVSFDFATANDTATTADSDYTGLSTTTRNFASTAVGATETITVQVNGDEKVELDETFFLNLSGIAAGGRDVTFADSQGLGTITNDDAATLSINDITQAETDAGTTAFTFTVTLNSEVDTGVSFDFATANDTATTADSDYTGLSTTTRKFASTAAGATETITVQVNGDTTFEPDETFFVDLSSIAAGGRAVTISDNQGLGTITNDDNGLDAMIDGGGNLVLAESGGNTIDILRISSDGTNLTITDVTNPLGTGGIAGATGDGTTTITIPLAAFTGGVIINSLGNNDSLEVDFSSVNPVPAGGVTFNGGTDGGGGDGADTVDASASAVAVTINGGGGADDITGTPLADAINGDADNDTITGGVGNDVIDGGADDDLLIWNNGDGSDMMDGGAGTDELEVNGSTVSPAGDMITISANATRFDLARADGGVGLGAFSLDVGTIETLDLNTLDGDDSVTVNDLTGIADLATLTIEVSAGNDTVDASALPNLGLSVMIEGGDDDTLTGSAGPSIINGNMGNDELNGGAADDTIMGGGGDDLMNGGAGGDMLTGQAGDDTMTGGLDDDTMNGGADTDLIVESGDTDFDLGDASLVSPLFGTDVLMDVEEADLNGGASANTIDASDFSGVATLMGGDSNDTITGAMGASAINGNADDDMLTGLGASDTIMGGGGNDAIDGGAGDDTLTGQANDDTIIGGLGDDNIMGGDDNDLINGSLGNDTISGDAGDDRIQGSNLSDYPGNPQSPIADLNTINMSDMDSLLGGAGADTIAGAIGADFIDGEGDADIIDAQSGGDTTDGIDTIVGGAGDIIFRDPEDTVL